ncbi:MAG: ABC transporter permease, partial [Fimbriimonadaceae bacterium]|nr:ABC transporter permease [Fimbriimonadaceae bacterium]
HLLDRETEETFEILYKILNVVITILVGVITVMMAMLMNIYQLQRVPEFGLLQAVGFTRKRLLGRVMVETVILVSVGWVLGVLCAFGMLHVIKARLMDPNAFMLDPADLVAYLYTIPVPLAILAASVIGLWRSFRRFDPISVVERRLV